MGSISENRPIRNGTDDVKTLDERQVQPMGMTPQAFLSAGQETIKDIEQYYTNLKDRTVLPSIEPGYLKKLLPESAPSQGELWSDIRKDIERTIMPGITHWQHPKYMAFFPANSTYPSILAEMWSAALTAPAFNWICSPAVTELETIVLDWLAQILGLSESFLSHGEGGGVIQGSASEAALVAMIAARERFVREKIAEEGLSDADEIENRSYEIRSKLVALCSDQAHSSIKKASIISGVRCRTVTTSDTANYALSGSELKVVLDQVVSQGLQPFFVSVTIGTTNTCAVDDIVSVANTIKDYPNIWLHCDAAYAGAALVLPQYHHLSRQLDLVDSFNMNMHKWLLVNFDTSPLYVKQRRSLIDALSISPAYLKNSYTDSGLVTDYRDWQIPLGRRFRALKVWFVLRTWGVEGLQAHIRHHLKLGDLFASLIKSRPDLFTILTPPAFALTVLAVVPTKVKIQQHHEQGTIDPPPFQDSQTMALPRLNDQEQHQANENTKRVYDLINDKKEFFLTSSVVGGKTAIRVVSANPLAEERFVRQVFEVLVDAAEDVLRAKSRA